MLKDWKTFTLDEWANFTLYDWHRFLLDPKADGLPIDFVASDIHISGANELAVFPVTSDKDIHIAGPQTQDLHVVGTQKQEVFTVGSRKSSTYTPGTKAAQVVSI